MRLVATAAAGPRRGPGRGGRRSGECDLGGDPRMRTGRRDAKSAFVRHGWAFLWLVTASTGPKASAPSSRGVVRFGQLRRPHKFGAFTVAEYIDRFRHAGDAGASIPGPTGRVRGRSLGRAVGSTSGPQVTPEPTFLAKISGTRYDPKATTVARQRILAMFERHCADGRRHVGPMRPQVWPGFRSYARCGPPGRGSGRSSLHRCAQDGPPGTRSPGRSRRRRRPTAVKGQLVVPVFGQVAVPTRRPFSAV